MKEEESKKYRKLGQISEDLVIKYNSLSEELGYLSKLRLLKDEYSSDESIAPQTNNSYLILLQQLFLNTQEIIYLRKTMIEVFGSHIIQI